LSEKSVPGHLAELEDEEHKSDVGEDTDYSGQSCPRGQCEESGRHGNGYLEVVATDPRVNLSYFEVEAVIDYNSYTWIFWLS
jgi:hypothetical protein